MKKLLCAGACVLAMVFVLINARAATATEFAAGQPQVSIDIPHIHQVLNLTPEQEPYWTPVESALRAIAHQQARNEQQGFVRRISHRVASFVLTSAAVERLAVAARPLIAVLRDDQKRAAGNLAQEMGLGPVLAALN